MILLPARRQLRLIFLILFFIVSSTIANAQQCAPASATPIRVGVLPVMNTLPLFVAQSEGFYADRGVVVELIPLESARDRSIGLQTGQLDVGNNDVMGAALQVASGDQLKIIRHDPFADAIPFFSIVTRNDSGLNSPSDVIAALAAGEIQIAVGHNTVTEYMASRLLKDAGYEVLAENYIEVSAIPLRLEQLMQGTVAAALLPEPLTTLAVHSGVGTAMFQDAATSFVPVVLTASQQAIEERPGDLCRFLAAYEDAVDAINADPEKFRHNELRIPEPIQDSYQVPKFAAARVPSEEELTLVLDWMIQVEMLDEAPAYDYLVDPQFLPREQ